MSDDTIAPRILGVAASHNGAACIMVGDRIAVAVQEERLTRRKRDRIEPHTDFAALDYVLEATGLSVDDLTAVALCPLHDAPAAARKLAGHPRLGHLPAHVVAHHRAHAAGAWHQSGWPEVTILVADGMGSRVVDLPDDERALLDDALPDDARETLSIYTADAQRGLTAVHKQAAAPVNTSALWLDGDLRPRMMPFNSLGTMYQSVAQQVFGQWDAAGKVMGLAPYGRPVHPVDAFVTVGAGGQLHFVEVPGARLDPRTRERWPEHRAAYADLAASVQRALEHALDAIVELAARHDRGARRLCFAGGVALNSVANARLLASGAFDSLFVMPAAEDNGTAMGAAVLAMAERTGAWHLHDGPLAHDALGREWPEEAVRDALDEALRDGAWHPHIEHPGDEDAVCARTVELLTDGLVVGWFQGRSEFGPRALGQRSILLDARLPDGKDLLNARVKHREPFRPFAPAILLDEVDRWFDRPAHAAPDSPYMLQVWPVRESRRAQVPAVVHVDGTGRVQTVDASAGRFHRLLEHFQARTGVPLVLNTSFNVAGEPIVESPADALRCLRATGIDALVIGNTVVVDEVRQC